MSQNSPEEKSNKMIGNIVVLVVLILGVYLFYKILPTLIALTANILYLALMLVVVIGFLAIVLNPKMRFLIGSFFRSLFR